MTDLQNVPHGTNLIDSEGKNIHMHWGVLLEQDTPTTGVYNGNQLQWEYMPSDWIALDYETWVDDIMKRDDLDEEGKDDAIEELSNCAESGDTHLYGSWKMVDGKYEADKNLFSDGFAAIYNANYNTLQVVWSSVIRYGVLASPCYPGQVSSEEEDPTQPDDIHVQSYFALPDGCIYTKAQHDKDLAAMRKAQAQHEAIKEAAQQ